MQHTHIGCDRDNTHHLGNLPGELRACRHLGAILAILALRLPASMTATPRPSGRQIARSSWHWSVLCCLKETPNNREPRSLLFQPLNSSTDQFVDLFKQRENRAVMQIRESVVWVLRTALAASCPYYWSTRTPVRASWQGEKQDSEETPDEPGSQSPDGWRFTAQESQKRAIGRETSVVAEETGRKKRGVLIPPEAETQRSGNGWNARCPWA